MRKVTCGKFAKLVQTIVKSRFALFLFLARFLLRQLSVSNTLRKGSDNDGEKKKNDYARMFYWHEYLVCWYQNAKKQLKQKANGRRYASFAVSVIVSV